MEDDRADAPGGVAADAVAEIDVSSGSAAILQRITQINRLSLLFELKRGPAGSSTLCSAELCQNRFSWEERQIARGNVVARIE